MRKRYGDNLIGSVVGFGQGIGSDKPGQWVCSGGT
jgi:hypothetical protein